MLLLRFSELKVESGAVWGRLVAMGVDEEVLGCGGRLWGRRSRVRIFRCGISSGFLGDE